MLALEYYAEMFDKQLDDSHNKPVSSVRKESGKMPMNT